MHLTEPMTKAIRVLDKGPALRDRWTGCDEWAGRHVSMQTANRLQSAGLVLRDGSTVRLSSEGRRVARALRAPTS